ncbi:MAG TPA: hypothetical protein VF476_07280 [Chitinophagaceae bacterium]
MKKVILLFITLIITCCIHAQLKRTAVCPEFRIDVLDGKINTLNIKSTNGQIKSLFPCFSKEEPETTTAKCGGSVFYKEKDLYFYTGRDYVEIGPAFKGKLTVPLMGANRNGLFKLLGHPKIKDVSWDAYQTAYGILILYFTKAGKVNKIQMSTESADAIKLCE